MSQEYSFNLTIPLADCSAAESILDEARKRFPHMRISRKTDRKACARYYLSFPFTGGRPDLAFEEWFRQTAQADWDLFGPTYGRWGLA
ncbi:MAG: hypothetical protein V2I35_11510 [Desulfocapsaceae bacterium]|jgi:hypothetical protein|nr:hypothetical protein [Desulfocapsaceae bacterium]